MEKKNIPKTKPKNKVLHGIIVYLSDWRNWLVHGLVGVGLLLLAILAPIAWWIKIIILVLVIIFNCVRMSIQKKPKQTKTNKNQE